MSLREDLGRTRRGKAYLAILDGIIAEPGFKAELEALEKALLEAKDPHGLATVRLALKHANGPVLEAAEIVHQLRIHDGVHDRFPENDK